MREIVTFVCLVVTVDGVAYAAPERMERCFEAGRPCVDTDGAEIVETTGEAVS